MMFRWGLHLSTPSRCLQTPGTSLLLYSSHSLMKGNEVRNLEKQLNRELSNPT